MIDWSRVSELKNEVGAEDFSEIVELFLDEVDEVVSRLGNAVQLETLGEDLHFLKGSALNLGFRKLSEMCQAGETAAAAGQPETVDVPPILAMYQASRAEFLDGNAQESAA